MRSLAILVGAAAITVSGPTLANPMMIVNEVYVQQVPGTLHVQITRNYSSGSPTTTTVTRDGTTLQIAFETTSAGSRDLGSGMANVVKHLGCDCSVPVGSHDYVVAGSKLPLTVVDAAAATGTVLTPSAQCDTQCASTIVAPPATGGSPSTGGSSTGGNASTGGNGNGGSQSSGGSPSTGGSNAGGSPSTGGSTGTTSASGGATAVVGNGGSTAIGGSTSTTSTGGPNKDNSDSSGCAVSRTASGLLPVGVMVALGLLVLRRRK